MKPKKIHHFKGDNIMICELCHGRKWLLDRDPVSRFIHKKCDRCYGTGLEPLPDILDQFEPPSCIPERGVPCRWLKMPVKGPMLCTLVIGEFSNHLCFDDPCYYYTPEIKEEGHHRLYNIEKLLGVKYGL